jgi:chromosome segregation ATPase
MLPARKEEVFSMESDEEKAEGRLGAIAADLGAARQQLERVEGRLDKVDGRLDKAEERLVGLQVSVAVLTDQSARTMADVSELKRDTKDLRKEISNAKIWALLIAATILGVLARGFHWI